MTATVQQIQREIIGLAVIVATLTNLITVEAKPRTSKGPNSVLQNTARLFSYLIRMCSLMNVVATDIIESKLELNKKKYNEAECKKRKDIFKWTEISQTTGINKHNQIIDTEGMHTFTNHANNEKLFLDNFESIADKVKEFAETRGWIDKYSMNSLALSFLAEQGELAESIQWHIDGEGKQPLSKQTKNKICMEIADLFIYAIHLCRETNVTKESLEKSGST